MLLTRINNMFIIRTDEEVLHIRGENIIKRQDISDISDTEMSDLNKQIYKRIAGVCVLKQKESVEIVFDDGHQLTKRVKHISNPDNYYKGIEGVLKLNTPILQFNNGNNVECIGFLFNMSSRSRLETLINTI